jgi:hypothetical protein
MHPASKRPVKNKNNTSIKKGSRKKSHFRGIKSSTLCGKWNIYGSAKKKWDSSCFNRTIIIISFFRDLSIENPQKSILFSQKRDFQK